MSDLAAALQVAIRVHADQRDKQGEPYLLHVLRVVEAVSDNAKVVAALHDVWEDGNESDRADAQGIITEQEDMALDLLTRHAGPTYAQYIEAIARNAAEDRFGAIAYEVKIADLRDNLGRIPPEPPWRRDSLGPHEAPQSVERRCWPNEWASLKARYEKALATLEGAK